MTAITSEYKQELGSRLLRSTYKHDKVHDVVESWNWNMGIFEIYDEIKEWTSRDIKSVLEYAYHYFNKDKFINELASHLTGTGFDD
jgi:hypothetical protein